MGPYTVGEAVSLRVGHRWLVGTVKSTEGPVAANPLLEVVVGHGDTRLIYEVPSDSENVKKWNEGKIAKDKPMKYKGRPRVRYRRVIEP